MKRCRILARSLHPNSPRWAWGWGWGVGQAFFTLFATLLGEGINYAQLYESNPQGE
jgi:hypothetical protein